METEQHTSKQPVGQRRTQKGNKKYLETTENGNATYQLSWNVAKAVLRGNFIAISGNVKKLDLKPTSPGN